jgi:hypothetical protein
MSPKWLRNGLAGLSTVLILAFALLFGKVLSPGWSGQQRDTAGRRASEKPVAMSSNLVQLEIALGLKDQEPTAWNGTIVPSRGKVQLLRAINGNAKSKIDGSSFKVKTTQKKKKAKALVRPVLRVVLDMPPDAEVTVKTAHGNFRFTPASLPLAGKRAFLDGQAAVERLDAAVRLTGPETEDDYPALARGQGDTAWLVYNEYLPGQELVKERVLAGNFEELVPKGNGDQVILKRFDGQLWHPGIEVTGPGLNIWRPAVAVDGKGRVVVAWSQQVDGNWDIYYRTYTPPGKGADKGSWSEVVRLTRDPGANFHVVAATDANGQVWLAWQAWRNGRFQIQIAALAADRPALTRHILISKGANNWCPAIATDTRGNVYVAWDAFDGDSYNVYLHRVGGEAKTFTVAASPRFEARPSIACDARNQVWIAYEEGDEQWGKDYTNATPQKVGLAKNPGNALYLQRTVRVKCLVGDKLMEPTADLQAVLNAHLPRGRSLPRLAVDAAGGLWLWLRHHPLPGNAGEVWDSYALRYDGKAWSGPRHIGSSSNLLDSRPALLAYQNGILAVHAGDDRLRTQQRDQDDLFAVLLKVPSAAKVEYVLKEDVPVTQRRVNPVHPREAEQVAAMRAYRIEHGGQKLQLLRGEFHRHTEYTSHQDQDGLLEDSWRYAQDAGGLDWMGNGDHDNGFGVEYHWWQIQKFTDLMHHPPRFVAALTYERSVVYPNGHRNVMFPRRGIRPLPRGNLKGTKEKGTADTKMLYAYLKRFGGICSSHTSATEMGTDWRDNDPVFEPVVEIYQGHRHNYEHLGAPKSATKETQIGGFEPDGFVWNALKKGYRLGFQCSSDHVSTHLSYGVVLTDDVSRQGIIDAFKKRHCYAANDNIILDVRCNGHIMGDEFTTGDRPQFAIVVRGTAAIAKLHLIRNGEYLHSVQPKQAEVTLRFTDPEPPAGRASWYYVRIEQADGSLAWSSPMWITYNPRK